MRFAKIKADCLSLKWDIETNIDGGPKARAIKGKLDKIGVLLFDIERDFMQVKP